MSYTPSTDETRLAYVAGTAERERIEVRSGAWLRLFDEFDRWLAGVKADVFDEGARASGARIGVSAGGMEAFVASLGNPYREAAGGTVA